MVDPGDSDIPTPEIEESIRKRLDALREQHEADLDEIENQLKAKQNLPDSLAVDGELAQRMATADQRLNEALAKRQEKAQELGRKVASDRDAARGLSNGLSAGYALVGGPIIGAGLGWIVDRIFSVTWGVGAGTILFTLIALLFVVRVLNRTNS